jgi:biopolymer transport protein ExbD
MVVEIDKGMALSNLSLTPLIDIVFLLLIFFLVATRFAEEERELDLRLAEAGQAQPLTVKPGALFINIDEQGRYFVSGKYHTLEELDPVLETAYANNPQRANVVVRVDRECPWQSIASAIDACKRASIDDYRLTTREIGEGP